MLLLARELAALGHRVAFLFPSSQGRGPGTAVFCEQGVRMVAQRSNCGSGTSCDSTMQAALDRMLQTDAPNIVYSFYQPEAMRWIATSLERYGSSDASRPIWYLRIAGLYPKWYLTNNPDKATEYRRQFKTADVLNYLNSSSRELFISAVEELDLVEPLTPTFVADIGVRVGETTVHTPAKNGRNPPRVIMVARFSRYQKRQDILIDALAHTDNDVELTLVGPGDAKYARNRAAAVGIAHRVHILGQMQQREVWSLVAQHDIFCLATEFEGIPKSVLESMAVGVPVLVSDVRPLNEIVHEGITGFLVQNEPRAWAKRINELIRERSLLEEVAHQANEVVKAEFSSARNVLLFEEEFSRRLDSRQWL